MYPVPGSKYKWHHNCYLASSRNVYYRRRGCRHAPLTSSQGIPTSQQVCLDPLYLFTVAMPRSYLNTNGSQFDMNCTNFTVEDFKHFNLSRSITAFVCSVITVVILMYLVRFKAVFSRLQRLFFYLIVATLFNETVMALNIEHQWQYRGQDQVCKWLGFFSHLSYVLVFTLSWEFIIHLIFLWSHKSEDRNHSHDVLDQDIALSPLRLHTLSFLLQGLGVGCNLLMKTVIQQV